MWWIHRIDPTPEVYLPGDDETDVSKIVPSTLSWDGKRLVATGKGLGAALHEVCHWLLATPERRKLPEYGLGYDPYRMGSTTHWNELPKITVGSAEAIDEEVFTCQLQLAAMVYLGFPKDIIDAESRNLGETLVPTENELRAIRTYRPEALHHSTWRALFRALAKYDAAHGAP